MNNFNAGTQFIKHKIYRVVTKKKSFNYFEFCATMDLINRFRKKARFTLLIRGEHIFRIQ